MIVIDMELPKTCRSCNLSFDAYGSITEGKCAALRFGVTYMNDRRNPICPIVCEIPGEHGRLIDADVFKEKIKTVRLERPVRNNAIEIVELGNLFEGFIDKAPTVLESTI